MRRMSGSSSAIRRRASFHENGAVCGMSVEHLFKVAATRYPRRPKCNAKDTSGKIILRSRGQKATMPNSKFAAKQ